MGLVLAKGIVLSLLTVVFLHAGDDSAYDADD